MEPPHLPRPDEAAHARSAALVARLRDEIERAGGWLRFDRYMQMALYEPDLGYYSAESAKLGAGGDFTTAAELGPLLPRAIATWAAPLLERLERPAILELGAGTGALAGHLLDALAARGRNDVSYRILEPSPSLRRRQQNHLRGRGVEWLETLPAAPIDGLILANEVADALPVVPFVKKGGRAVPLGVESWSGGFRWREGGDDAELRAAVAALESLLAAPLPAGYRSEICLLLRPWIAALAATLGRGAMLLIDYGLPRRELYHAERSSGTLICHYRHRAHDDPFLWPGLQDISAWVDFSACADAGRTEGLAVSGYTSQAHFLLEELAALEAPTGAAAIAQRNAIKTLVLPGEMGERFKVLLLTRGTHGEALPGRDLRGRL